MTAFLLGSGTEHVFLNSKIHLSRSVVLPTASSRFRSRVRGIHFGHN